MHRLGCTRYVAQGGDAGTSVTDRMGRQAPEGLAGIHLNLLVTALAAPQSAQSGQEHAAPDALATFRASGFGYFLEQATRPQTIGYALLDSPVALAAWMIRAPRGVLAHPGRRPSYEWPRPPAPDASRWFRLLPDELYPDLPAAGQGGQFAWKKLAS